MSGPFGFSITVISGQKCAQEIVVAASTFLSTTFLSISPVAAPGGLRDEFLAVLGIFAARERIHYYESPAYFATRIIEPDVARPADDLFCLALDREGQVLAERLFEASGDPARQKVYRSVERLNLLAPPVPPPPHNIPPFWQRLFPPLHRQAGTQPYLPYRPSRNPQAPLTQEQIQCYAWCETLYETLIPWQDTIKNIQSDYS